MMLRGVFLTSEQPADTARFYREVAGLPMEQVGESGGYVYWRLDDGRMQLAIHDALSVYIDRHVLPYPVLIVQYIRS